MRRLVTTLTILCFLGLGTALAQPADPAPTPDTPVAEPAAPEVVPEVPPAPEPAPAAEPTEATTAPVAEAPAPAPAETVQPPLSRILGHAIDIIASVLGVLLLWLVGVAISYFTKKTKIEIPERTEAMIKGWAMDAKNYACEQAHKYRKEHGEKLDTGKKLDAGIGFGLSLAEEYGLPNLARDKLVKYIESVLGANRDD